jgi:hypothetical protein
MLSILARHWFDVSLQRWIILKFIVLNKAARAIISAPLRRTDSKRPLARQTQLRILGILRIMLHPELYRAIRRVNCLRACLACSEFRRARRWCFIEYLREYHFECTRRLGWRFDFTPIPNSWRYFGKFRCRQLLIYRLLPYRYEFLYISAWHKHTDIYYASPSQFRQRTVKA